MNLLAKTKASSSKADRFETPHGEEVGHHCGEPRSQAALRYEAQLQFC